MSEYSANLAMAQRASVTRVGRNALTVRRAVRRNTSNDIYVYAMLILFAVPAILTGIFQSIQ